MTSDERQSPATGEEHGGGKRHLPLASVVRSVASAAFGVQSNRNKERDFVQGNYRHFIIGGIVFTVLFVLTLALVVAMVLNNAGGG